jgi:hypothetical protein
LDGGRAPLQIALPRFGVGGFQIADQSPEGFLVGVVVLPVAEVGDEIFANLAGGIFAGIGVEAAWNLLTRIYESSIMYISEKRSPLWQLP